MTKTIMMIMTIIAIKISTMTILISKSGIRIRASRQKIRANVIIANAGIQRIVRSALIASKHRFDM